MTRLRRLAVVAMLLSLTARGALATGLVFLTDENPPFNFSRGGRIVGAGAEIVTQVANRAGIATRTEMLPWDTAYTRAQAERNTCLFSTARLENRERLFLWVGPIATNFWALYGRSDFGAPIRTLKDLAPYRIGAVSRDAKGDFLRENAITKLKLVRDDRDNPPRLLLPADHPDHIDLWITGLHGAREMAKAVKVSDVKLVFIAAEQPLYLACSPQTDRGIVHALSEALEALKTDGTVARINASYDKKLTQ